MAKYQLLPAAIDRVERIMHQQRIRPLDPGYLPAVAAKKQARFYMAPVVTAGGATVWFKSSLQASPWLRRGLKEEIGVQHALGDYEHRYHPLFDSPSFLAAEDHGQHLWLIRKYWQGDFAGDMDTHFGLTADFMNRVSAGQMARVMADVRAMTGFMRRRLPLEVHGLGWYRMDFHYYLRHFFRPLLRHRLNPGWRPADMRQMEKVLLQHAAFFRRHANTFAHGDMYPNNIMVRNRHRVVLFDWELTHLNLPTFDAVMLYLHAWRLPRWQEQFKRETLRLLGQPATTRTAWRLSTLSLATRLTAFAFIRLTNSLPERFPRLPAKFRPTMQNMYRRNLAFLQAAYHDTGL